MSFQDKYKEYKERQEAKKYFRSNNDQFLDSTQWSKVIGIGLLTAIAAGVVLGIVIHSLHITSSLFYVVCAIVVSSAVTKISQIHSSQMAILSVILTVFCYVIGEMTMIYLPLHEMGVSLPFASFLDIFVMSVRSLIVGDLFTTIVALIGLFIAYASAKEKPEFFGFLTF